MSAGATPYPFPPAIRSSLLKNPTDATPPTEDLETLQSELRVLRQKTLERMKKAGDDLIAIQESFKRLKEKEKGKGKAVEKVKKERGCTCLCLTPILNVQIIFVQSAIITSRLVRLATAVTPLPNGDDKRLSVQPPSLQKSRLLSAATSATQSRASSPPFDPRKA